MERLTQERPTGPYRADCGHLCNCYPLTHEGEQWYEHDIYDVYGESGASNDVVGTECGTCYRARMEAATANMSMGDVVAAFSGGIIR